MEIEENRKKRKARKAKKIVWIFGISLLSVMGIGLAVILTTFWMQSRNSQKAEEAVNLKENEVNNVIATDEDRTDVEKSNPAEIPEEKSEETISDNQIPDEDAQAVLCFGGDVCFEDDYSLMQAYKQRGEDITKCISADLLEEMQSADICMVNNEFTYTNRGEAVLNKTYTFRSKPENVEILKNMGVDIVGLANNHAYDYGEISLLDTLDTLDSAGILHVGAGKNLSEARKPAYFNINGIRISLVCATQIERLEAPDTKGATENSPGVFRCFSEEELNRLLATVSEAKTNSDITIVYIHWGTENTDTPDWAQTYQADMISKAGADLIVGSHPHCLQGIDKVNGVPIVYSLGNFWFNSKELDTALFKVIVTRNGIEKMQIIPAVQKDCSTTGQKEAEKSRILTYLQSLSANVTIDENGYIN